MFLGCLRSPVWHQRAKDDLVDVLVFLACVEAGSCLRAEAFVRAAGPSHPAAEHAVAEMSTSATMQSRERCRLLVSSSARVRILFVMRFLLLPPGC